MYIYYTTYCQSQARGVSPPNIHLLITTEAFLSDHREHDSTRHTDTPQTRILNNWSCVSVVVVVVSAQPSFAPIYTAHTNTNQAHVSHICTMCT